MLYVLNSFWQSWNDIDHFTSPSPAPVSVLCAYSGVAPRVDDWVFADSDSPLIVVRSSWERQNLLTQLTNEADFSLAPDSCQYYVPGNPGTADVILMA